MQKSLLIILLFCTYTAHTQNYNCFQPSDKKYFINGNGYVRGIRIDSTTTSGSDVIYYPYQTIRKSNYITGVPTLDSTGGSWLGKKIIKKADGTFLFDNIWDTITIKTQAHTGDSWIFFNDTFNIYYTATVTAEDTMSISGIIDSVKKITIKADSTGGVPYTADPVNNFEIILSKNSGFVQVFDLYTFPYHRPDTFSFHPPDRLLISQIDFYLDALLNNLGSCDLCLRVNAPDSINSLFHVFELHNPTQMELNNFAAGDIYEWHSNTYSIGGSVMADTYSFDSIMTKTLTADNVTYTGSMHRMNAITDFSHTPISHDTTYTSAPISIPADTSHLIDRFRMPEESVGGYILYYHPHLIFPDISCDSPESYSFLSILGFAYNGITIVPSIDSTVYSIGYGKSAHVLSIAYGTQQFENYNYIIKDSIPCGSPANIDPYHTSVPENLKTNEIIISPNPATDYLNVSAGCSISSHPFIFVYNEVGNCVFRSEPLTPNNLVIDIKTWLSGLYIVICQNDYGISGKKKIIINH